MGNREDLLAAAKRCLIEKGYARTTARDLTAASGVSLAAIGYHFGSKDALMNAAVYESIGDWGDELQRTLVAAGAWDAKPLARFEVIAEQLISSFSGPSRGLWAAQLELIALAQHNEDLRQYLASLQDTAATALAALFLGIDPDLEPEAARQAGYLVHALFLGMVVKWFLDPPQTPAPAEMAEGLRILCQRFVAG